MVFLTSAFSESDLNHKWSRTLNIHSSFYIIECSPPEWILPLIFYVVIVEKKINRLFQFKIFQVVLLNFLFLRKSVNLSFSYRSLKNICWKGSPIYPPFIFYFFYQASLHTTSEHYSLAQTNLWSGPVWLFFWYAAVHQVTGSLESIVTFIIGACKSSFYSIKCKGSKLVSISFKNWEEWIIRVSITTWQAHKLPLLASARHKFGNIRRRVTQENRGDQGRTDGSTFTWTTHTLSLVFCSQFPTLLSPS